MKILFHPLSYISYQSDKFLAIAEPCFFSESREDLRTKLRQEAAEHSDAKRTEILKFFNMKFKFFNKLFSFCSQLLAFKSNFVVNNTSIRRNILYDITRYKLPRVLNLYHVEIHFCDLRRKKGNSDMNSRSLVTCERLRYAHRKVHVKVEKNSLRLLHVA